MKRFLAWLFWRPLKRYTPKERERLRIFMTACRRSHYEQ